MNGELVELQFEMTWSEPRQLEDVRVQIRDRALEEVQRNGLKRLRLIMIRRADGGGDARQIEPGVRYTVRIKADQGEKAS